MEQLDDATECDAEGGRYIAVASFGSADGFDAFELAVMLAALQGEYHLVDEVVDVKQFEFDRGVVDLNGQAVGDVVAEGGDGGVVVGATPLAEEVWKAVDKNFRSGFAGVVEEEFLAGFLALAVGMAGIAADERGLNGAREHHGAAVAVIFERVEQCRGEAEVAFAEVFGILGAVDTGEVEHEVGFAAVMVKLFGGRIEVIFEDLVDCDGIVAGLAVADIVELGAEVTAHEAFCAGY